MAMGAMGAMGTMADLRGCRNPGSTKDWICKIQWFKGSRLGNLWIMMVHWNGFVGKIFTVKPWVFTHKISHHPSLGLKFL
jgi:hypothetical protein